MKGDIGMTDEDRLLHQHAALSVDIHNREKLVWTIGGILLPASFLLIGYSLTNIENVVMVLFGGATSIILGWFFIYLNLSYSHINHKKFYIRNRIEYDLGLRCANIDQQPLHAYKHERTYVGWALTIFFIIIHLCWTAIWYFYDSLIDQSEFIKIQVRMEDIAWMSFISLLILVFWIIFYNIYLIDQRKELKKELLCSKKKREND